MAVWINEFHYDNAGTDAGEFIEVAGTAGTNLSGWSLVLYNGNPTQRTAYSTTNLTGTIPDQGGGFGTVSFAIAGIQNGNATNNEPDGIALANGTTLVQFLSYEGSFTASGGVADGVTSTDVGVIEGGGDPVGGSLALTGTGDEYADFAWTLATDDTPGAVNGGQSFGGTPGETVSINDLSVAEGNAGTATLTFTVTRSGNAGAFTLDYATADGTATAGSDYVATSGTLSFAAGGALTQTISVTVNGDTAAEPDETVLVNLTNLVGGATLADAQGVGTITNDEVVLTEIAAIQGAGHRSPLATTLTGNPTGTGNVAQAGNSGNNRYNVEGVVTAIAGNGFYIQDPTPDADERTSDGIFVFTSTAPAATITVGETVRVLGARVDEFRAATNNLTLTQLNASLTGASIVELGGNSTIAPTIIGTGGRLPPTGGVEDDGFTSFDIATDAADFYESLEGMLVQLPNPVAVSITSEFRTRDPANSANAAGPPNEEIWVLAEGTYDPASLTPRGAPLLGPTDVNPERIQLDDLTPDVDLPSVSVGAVLQTVTGVVNYDFQNYEVLVTGVTVATPSTLAEETTAITRDLRQLTVATYNVENLDAEVEDTAAGSVAGNDLYTRLGESDDDVGSGKYATHARHIAENLAAPAIVALQEVQDNDGAEISSDVDSARTLQVLVDLIQATYGITYAFAYENPPMPNTDGGQPNANIRPAFLYRPDIVSLVDTTRITDPNPGEADGFAGDDFASSRKPLEGVFTFNGQTVTVINNHFNSKGGDNAVFGNVQPPVLSSELQRIEQARVVNARVDALLAADADAKVIVLGDLNDFTWSAPLRTLDGTAGGGARVLTDLAEATLPANERYGYNFQGNAQLLDHILVTNALLAAAPAFDIVHVNSDLATGVSDHDPSLARFDFRAFGENLVLGAGNDSVDGEGGADTLDGGAGRDTLAGGIGNDLFRVGDRGDRVVEAAGEGADTISASVSLRLAAEVEGGVLEGSADLDLFGNDLDNVLLGNGGANLLLGAAGDDTIDGAGGADRVIGQDGDDLLRGGDGNDTLQGVNGADTLDGGAGRDELIGGFGADLFLFTALPAAGEADLIIGFRTGEDRIGVLGSAFDPTLAAGALDPARYVANRAGQATDAGVGTFVFETDTRQLWWDTDGAGAGRVLVADVRNAIVTAGDIVVV